jgi:hypothetical protein
VGSRQRRLRLPRTRPPRLAARALTYEAALHIYKHALATIAWAVFWFSTIGGVAGDLMYESTDNRLDNPLVIASMAAWSSLAAAVAFVSRSDARRLARD